MGELIWGSGRKWSTERSTHCVWQKEKEELPSWILSYTEEYALAFLLICSTVGKPKAACSFCGHLLCSMSVLFDPSAVWVLPGTHCLWLQLGCMLRYTWLCIAECSDKVGDTVFNWPSVIRVNFGLSWTLVASVPLLKNGNNTNLPFRWVLWKWMNYCLWSTVMMSAHEEQPMRKLIILSLEQVLNSEQ